MAAGIYNLSIEQGSSWELQMSIDSSAGNDLDITGYTFDAKIAKSYYDDNPVSITANIVNAVTGSIRLTLTPAQTSALDSAIEYIHDVDMTSTVGTVTRLMEGRATISPGL
jgi:DNA-binding MurR/RpiR family transcriptional regulator